MVVGISVQFNAIIPCGYIQYTEHLLSTISAQSFGEYRGEYEPALNLKEHRFGR